jgi:hypothetical protein
MTGITASEDRRIAIICGEGGRKLCDIIADQPLSVGEAEMNACVIAAAGSAAHEARKMGYDPQAVIEKLPEILRWAETALDEAEFTDEGETPRRTPPSPSTLINLRNAMIEARADD